MSRGLGDVYKRQNFVRTSHYPPTERFLEYCDRYGIYVVDVVSGGPADQAGLKAGDRIISIDNTEVAQKTDLGTLMQEHSAGDTLSITIARDGQMQTVSLTLGEKNASNSGSASTNGAARQETPSESAPQQDPQG
mgnify:CR=1 FL=1